MMHARSAPASRNRNRWQAKAGRLAAFAALAVLTAAASAQTPPPPVQVTIKDEKTQVVEAPLPVDATKILAQPTFPPGSMSYGLTVEGKRLTFSTGSAQTLLKIN